MSLPPLAQRDKGKDKENGILKIINWESRDNWGMGGIRLLSCQFSLNLR